MRDDYVSRDDYMMIMINDSLSQKYVKELHHRK